MYSWMGHTSSTSFSNIRSFKSINHAEHHIALRASEIAIPEFQIVGSIKPGCNLEVGQSSKLEHTFTQTIVNQFAQLCGGKQTLLVCKCSI